MVTKLKFKIKKTKSNHDIWSVDRIARLIVGVANTTLLFASYFIHAYFLLGLLLVNINLILSSVTDSCPFKKLLLRLGAKEREYFYYPDGEPIRKKM